MINNKTNAENCQDYFAYFFNYFSHREGYFSPAADSGKPYYKDTPEGRIGDWSRIEKWKARGVTRFIFRPAVARLLVIDLDRHPGQPDGVAAFQELTGINPYSHSFHVLTPGGGILLYYSTTGEDYLSTVIAPSVEVKSKAFITAPGSQSDKGVYKPVGDPCNIPAIPNAVKKLLKVRETQQPAGRQWQYHTDRSIDELASIVARTDGLYFQPGGRNRSAFAVAKICRKKNKSAEDVIEWIASRYESNDFTRREIAAAVKSAYSYNR